LQIECVAWSAQRIPTAVNLGFSRPGAATFPFKYLLSYIHEAEGTPFQTHYFSENLESNPGPLVLYPGTLTTEAVFFVPINRNKSIKHPILGFYKKRFLDAAEVCFRHRYSEFNILAYGDDIHIVDATELRNVRCRHVTGFMKNRS
jgi:hypothetical protein